jgi:hypothetical protein
MSMQWLSSLPRTDERMCSIHLFRAFHWPATSRITKPHHDDPVACPELQSPEVTLWLKEPGDLLTCDKSVTNFSLAGIKHFYLHIDEPQAQLWTESLYRRQAKDTALHCIAYSTRGLF